MFKIRSFRTAFKGNSPTVVENQSFNSVIIEMADKNS